MEEEGGSAATELSMCNCDVAQLRRIKENE